ncbi:RagB/SusD family nutrient uptake outer membrane protein [Pseudoflavitalea sp. X16]|uniref:RagB/SusD family nutrient uptake outer membrane protein n=1 Tax=Paraflavitalea devenefica TaxID=2716334 RepID=UPI00141D8BBD|nr:RagB/SusD family nutrient uptake outer membrane protein [Paraflavitalea devenefica]NII25262.1 RagB/SusD family nutrient uptake outer membrane protein [Paraflavitalea devenefica]
MKILYKITVIAVLITIGTVVSCKKFIKEDLVTTLTMDYYKTDQGMEDLVKSAYAPLRWKFEGEQSYALWNFGTDEFRLGDQFNNEHWNKYNSLLNPNGSDGFVNTLWTNSYAGINRCNLGIELISAFTDANSRLLGTPAQRNQRIAELRALRAYYFFQLVQQFGGVPLVNQSSDTLRTEFPRASVAAIYEQIIGDLRSVAPVLSYAIPSERGRISKSVAYHFLAKAYLTRASAVTEARGQKATDLDSAIIYGDSVIKAGAHNLEANYANLYSASYANHTPPKPGFDGATPLGDASKLAANNNSTEIIFAAQFSNNLAIAGSGNRVHLYYPTQYDAGIPIPGMIRDAFNGRPFRRLRPTDYTIDIFDRINDSRFFKSFQTVYYRNAPTSHANSAAIPVFTAANAPSPDLVGKKMVGIGDTAGLFVVNTIDRPFTLIDSAKFRARVYARYKQRTPSSPITSDFSDNKYLTLIKFLDGVRLTADLQEERGIRNGTLARVAETYLIVAEAYGRKADYAKALEYVNVVRKRAAYKAGEPKNPHHWLFYGGTEGDVNSTETAMQATAALFTTNAASEMYPPTVSSTEERFIHFMLNERTRELCGELYRWEDLARTESLYARTKLYNADATNLSPFHKLRPIPLPQIISLKINGRPLTGEEITAYQNAGYN